MRPFPGLTLYSTCALTCYVYHPRMLHVDRRILQNAVRNVLDGELLNRYLYLSTMERSELAKKIGTTPDIVSNALALGLALALTTLPVYTFTSPSPTDPG